MECIEGLKIQEFIDAVITLKSEKVHKILHENGCFASHLLSECLLQCIQQICQKNNIFDNFSEVCQPPETGYDIIFMLLDAGADIDKTDADGNTCIFYAAFNEDCHLCDILLQCGADMWAMTEYDVPVYDYVSQKSTSKSLIDTFNKFYPGLWKAVEHENIYQVRQLINYWCRTNVQMNGIHLKDIALQTGNEEIINLIFGVYESMNLIFSIFAKNTEAVKKKLETCKTKLRLNLRKMSDHGAPILYYLIQSRDVPTIELFIKYDCQIYTVMRDSKGNDMPVLFSALKPDMPVTVMEALLPKNKIQMEEILHKILYKGMTVLEIALEKRVSPEIFTLLIDRGGPLLLCDRNQFNETILDVAITLNDQDYIDAIDQCVYEWIHNPKEYGERRFKLSLLGWRFEPIQYMDNEVLEDSVSKFLTDVNLLQTQIEGMSLAIENGDVQKFTELKATMYDSRMCETNMLWHARIVGDGVPLLHRAVLFNQPEILEIILDDKPLKESIDNLFDQHHRTALHYAFACSSAKKIQKLLLNYGCSEHVLDKINREPLDFKDKQDSPTMIELLNRLKSKNYFDCEPDPWKSIVSEEGTEGEFQTNENYFNDSKNLFRDSRCSECDFKENGNQKLECSEYEDSTEDKSEGSEVDEESRLKCLIS